MTKSKNILITGGCGFIGVNLVNYLLRKGFNYIRILDNLSAGTKEKFEDALRENGEIISKKKDDKVFYEFRKIFLKDVNENTLIELIIGDIRNYDTCLKATKEIDSVIHLAAHAGVIPSIENPFYDFEVNIKGTLNLLYSSVKNKVEKFIFASSNAPLGNQKPPMNEEMVPKPLSPYGASKLACEGYCSAFYHSYDLKTVILRFSNVYGPYCLHKNSVISKFIKDGLTKKILTIYGDGKQTRDFLYVEDLCQIVILFLNLKNSISSVWGEIFNLGTGRETRVINVAKIIKRLFKNKIQIVFEPTRKAEIKRNYSDIGKVIKITKYTPRIDLETGIRKVYTWFLEQDRGENTKCNHSI